MAKKTSPETDEARLNKKVRDWVAKSDNPEGNAALRSLHKRLRRTQRKRRRLAARVRHAMGKKAAGADARADTKVDAKVEKVEKVESTGAAETTS